MAIIEAFDMQAVSIRGATDHLYINSEGVTFKENDWYLGESQPPTEPVKEAPKEPPKGKKVK